MINPIPDNFFVKVFALIQMAVKELGYRKPDFDVPSLSQKVYWTPGGVLVITNAKNVPNYYYGHDGASYIIYCHEDPLYDMKTGIMKSRDKTMSLLELFRSLWERCIIEDSEIPRCTTLLVLLKNLVDRTSVYIGVPASTMRVPSENFIVPLVHSETEYANIINPLKELKNERSTVSLRD